MLPQMPQRLAQAGLGTDRLHIPAHDLLAGHAARAPVISPDFRPVQNIFQIIGRHRHHQIILRQHRADIGARYTQTSTR
jgi:hypothetical protein